MNKENYDIHKEAFRNNVTTLGALLTFCLLGVIQLLTRETLSNVHHIFVALSAVAIPLLAISVSIHYLEYSYKQTRRPPYLWWCISTGLVSGIGAVIILFFSFHWLTGVFAAVACGIGFAVEWSFIDELKDANPEDFENEESEQKPAP